MTSTRCARSSSVFISETELLLRGVQAADEGLGARAGLSLAELVQRGLDGVEKFADVDVIGLEEE